MTVVGDERASVRKVWNHGRGGTVVRDGTGHVAASLQGLEHGWHVAPDGKEARAALDEIDRSTLGHLLSSLKSRVGLEGGLEERFASALTARNRLNHGFYERHNFRIQTDEGRDAMIADLEAIHDELFHAWRIAGAMASVLSDIILREVWLNLPREPD